MVRCSPRWANENLKLRSNFFFENVKFSALKDCQSQAIASMK